MFTLRTRTRRTPSTPRARLGVEMLETRLVPSSISDPYSPPDTALQETFLVTTSTTGDQEPSSTTTGETTTVVTGPSSPELQPTTAL